MKPDAIAQEYSRKVRSALGSRVRDIILFGSRARGDNKEWSDYDMLLVVDRKDKSLRNAVTDIEVGILNFYDRLVGSIIFESSEWEWKKESPLGMNIKKDGIRL